VEFKNKGVSQINLNIANIITSKSRIEDINGSEDIDDLLHESMNIIYGHEPIVTRPAKMKYDQIINSPKFISKL
jgi:hypothetical protein